MKKDRGNNPQKIVAKDDIGLSCPIVGIGASAGGLEAFTQLLKELPADTGLAYVLIQHLDPSHPSLLAEALKKATAMPVTQILHETKVAANHVYVIPPNCDLSISESILRLLPREKTARKPHLPINTFFRALATNCESRAIGVVLSGNATDGTDGLKAIKDQGGFTFA